MNFSWKKKSHYCMENVNCYAIRIQINWDRFASTKKKIWQHMFGNIFDLCIAVTMANMRNISHRITYSWHITDINSIYWNENWLRSGNSFHLLASFFFVASEFSMWLTYEEWGGYGHRWRWQLVALYAVKMSFEMLLVLLWGNGLSLLY